jgi:uncharacterized membrane protein
MFFYFVDGINTFIILLLIVSVFFACWKFNNAGSYLLRFIGVFVMVSAIYSPTYLLNYSEQGDHVSMQGHTFIPSIVWIGVWVLCSLFFLYRAFKASTVLKTTTEPTL